MPTTNTTPTNNAAKLPAEFDDGRFVRFGDKTQLKSDLKPNIPFLKKVAAGGVYRFGRYSPRKGSYIVFHGGETTAQKHADAGYIIMPGVPSIFKKEKAILTPLGEQILAL